MKLALLTTDSREHFKTYERPLPYFGAAPEALIDGFRSLPDLEVHIVSCVRQKMTSPEKLAPNIWFHNLLVSKSGWMRTLYRGCVRAVRSKLRQIRPDIVHGQGSERDCALTAVCSGFPAVVTIHGNMAELARLFHASAFSFQWLAARLEDFALKRSTGVFCNSAYTEQLVAPRTPRTWRVPNALRMEFFSPPTPGERASKCTLLNVGVITERKRQLELLDLAEQLYRKGCRFELLFLGEAYSWDPYGAQFLERIKPMEAAGYARYLGMRPVKELVELFDHSHALIHIPSEEAFGLVVAEALARDLKFFGSRVGGIIDISQDAPGVELFGLEDWAGLSSALATWIESGARRPSGAAEVMRARYHPEIIARRHLEIYREVLRSDS